MSQSRRWRSVAVALGLLLAGYLLVLLFLADKSYVCACQDGTLRTGISGVLIDKERLCADVCREHGGGRWLRDGWLTEAEIEALQRVP